MTECGQVETVEQTSLELVDFMMIISDIKLNRFLYDLPDSIRMIAKDDETENTDRSESRKKRKQSSDKALPKIVMNNNMEQTWRLKDTESWQTWGHKTGNGPILSVNAKPCLKYHVRGSCFEDCTNKASHCTLTGEDFKNTDNFIKQIRSESK